MYSGQLSASESSSEYRAGCLKKKKEWERTLTRLVGHDRAICSAYANAHLLIVHDTDVWVNANAVGFTPVEQGHDGHQETSNGK